jgi:hypothetical protein
VTARREEQVDPPDSNRRGLRWLIVAMVVLLVAGLAIDQVASGFRTARKVAAPVDPTAVVNGAGLAFRCRDAGNCWWVQAVPAFHTWNIIRIVDGHAALMGNLGRANVESGTRIEVASRGDRLTFSVDGAARRTIVDGSLRRVPGAGFMITAGDRTGQAHWDDFTSRAASGSVQDSFDRPDADQLGSASSGAWRALRGVWGIRDSQASVVRPIPGGLNLALVNVGENARVSARLSSGVPPSTVVDDFARADSTTSLGAAGSGQRWRARRGVWGVDAGAAYVVRSIPHGVDLALVSGGAADGTAEVAVTTMRQGAGLAFRCRGPGNCWRLEAVPRFGTWNVLKVVRNQEHVVTNLGTVPVVSGTTVGVEMAGSRLRFLVNGQVRKVVRDPALHQVAGVGLAISAGSEASGARWDRFRSSPEQQQTDRPSNGDGG